MDVFGALKITAIPDRSQYLNPNPSHHYRTMNHEAFNKEDADCVGPAGHCLPGVTVVQSFSAVSSWRELHV